MIPGLVFRQRVPAGLGGSCEEERAQEPLAQVREISEVATLSFFFFFSFSSFFFLFSEVVCGQGVASGPPAGLSLKVSCRILYAS